MIHARRPSRRLVAGILLAAAGLSIVAGAAVAQRGWSGNWRRQRDYYDSSGKLIRNGVPDWTNDADFQHDVFTFVRIRYSSYRRGWAWDTDYPDSDLNFSYRLQQLTSLKVHPEGRVLELTDPELFKYPFIYMIEPGNLVLDDDEIQALRRYLLNGGFLMVDDFWGDSELANLHEQLRSVFPDRVPEELPLSHEIFHNVYDLKERPQIPAIGWAQRGRDLGITYEPSRDGSDTSQVHYQALFDDAGRIMVIICHNTDLGDGWEREGEDEWYFREFSEKKAYPLGINIVTYAMTH